MASPQPLVYTCHGTDCARVGRSTSRPGTFTEVVVDHLILKGSEGVRLTQAESGGPHASGGSGPEAMDAFYASQRLVPELTAKLRSRYRVLQRIFLHQPIGRRSLAQVVGVTERVLRADVELLKEQGLITAGPIGMSLTTSGEHLIESLDGVVRRLDGRSGIEQALSQRLGIPRVVVVAGDSHADDVVMRDIGYAAANLLREYLQVSCEHPACTVAITGGTTIAMVAEMMPKSTSVRPIEVLPARGGLGERVELLANTIASRLADKLGATYRMFHVPESLSRATAERLAKEPAVLEVVERIRGADVALHGIGDALTMAYRRGLDEATVMRLQTQGAIAEAFGYFFDATGHTVHMMNTVGLRLEDLSGIGFVIGVAGGSGKGRAIRAAARAYRMDALVTDEGAATAILADGTQGNSMPGKDD